MTTPTKRTGVCIRNRLTPALVLARAPSLADRNEKDRAQTREDAPGGRLLLAPHGLFYVLRLPPHPRTRNPFAFASPGVSVAYVPACGRGRGRGVGGGRGGVRACVLVGSGLVGGFGGLSVAGPLCLKQLVSLPNSPMAEQARVLVLQRKVLPCLGFSV